jgi:hypothetical protein
MRYRRIHDAGRLPALALGLLLVIVACGGDGAAADPSVQPSSSPDTVVLEASPTPMASIDPEGLCRRIGELELSVARLRGIELKLTNRQPLDIELDELRLAFREVRSADRGEFADELEDPFTRLEYRLGELELAVEDFRTNRRPRNAAPHVRKDAETFADELTAFRVLARC